MNNLSKSAKLPVPDSIHTEPFENIVELYYQTQGYITSSNKWFNGKQDIDILAFNKQDTLIIQVSINLNKKVTKQGHPENNLIQYYKNAKEYLKNCPQYSWLMANPRNIKKKLVYEAGWKKEQRNGEVKEVLKGHGIELISSDEVIKGLCDYIGETQKGHKGKNLKTNNPTLMLSRLFFANLPKSKKSIMPDSNA